MGNTLYDRIKELCRKRRITISSLESSLGFGNASIKKWEKATSPSIEKIKKVAVYFGVSIDYLMGLTDIEGSASQVIGDEDIISLQRAREKMTPQDRDRMMRMIKAGFDYAFEDDEGDK